MSALTLLRTLAVATALLLTACPDSGRRPIGASCGNDGDCASGFCAATVCLDPAGDDDLDGIANGVEAVLGSDPLQRDSDFDGDPDGTEVASDQAGVDTDGDGKLDIVESRASDADRDCIPDQYDAQDDVPNTDLSPMRDVVCRTAGICAEQTAALGVACPNGVAVCLYNQIVGYAEAETRCDEADENCDGRVDEGFPPGCQFFDWDADGVTDTLDVCPETSDAAQLDSNADGIGDACVSLYEVIFDPSPPTALSAGETFPISGRVARKGDGAGAPMPTFKGRIDLATLPRGGVRGAAAPIANAFTYDGLAFTLVGTWRFALQSNLGSAESAPVVVSPGPVATLELTAPAKVTAGEPFAVSADARDAFGNRADFDLPATLTANDFKANIPDPGRFEAGEWSLAGLSLAALGDTTLTLAAGDVTASAVVRVSLGKANELELTLPTSVRAAVPVEATLTVRDGSGNVQTSFVGTVALSSDDLLASLPATVSFSADNAGVRTFTATFGTLGVRTVTATIGTLSAVATTTVRPGPPYSLVLTTMNPATTGVPQVVFIALVDAFGHLANDPAAPYTGTVSFGLGGSVPDLMPSLPSPITFTAADLGQREVATTWYRQGLWRLSATGTGLAVPSATVDIDVALSPGVTLELTAPANAKAGVPVDVTVSVRAADGNIATGFTGTIALSDDDPHSNLPAFLPLGEDHAGTRTIQVTFGSVGNRTIDARLGPLADSATLAVVAGAPYGLTLSAPGPAVVGQSQSVEVKVVDRFGNVANDPAAPYLGTLSYEVLGTQPNPPPQLPAPIAMTAANQGRTSADLLWFQLGTFTLAANGTGLVIPQATQSVRVELATGLEVTLPDVVKSGVPVDVTVRATGRIGTTATGFVGTVSLRDDDAHSTLPPSLRLDAADGGVRTFRVTFGDAGTRTVFATFGVLSGSDATTVLAGSPRTLKLSVSGQATTGVPKTARLTVVDALGQIASDPADAYTGTVSFDIAGAQPDLAPLLPGPTTFAASDLSAKDVTTTWLQVGTWSLRATGTALNGAVATATAVVVGTPATRLEVALPATARSGVAVPLTVTARDANGNIVTGFVGTIALSNNDSGANVPGTLDLGPDDAGTRTINVSFARSGVRTVTARWNTVSASASTLVTAGAPQTILLLGGNNATTGVGLSVRVVIVDGSGNVVSDPADAYRGTVTFRANGPTPPAPEFLPPLAPGLPGPTTFTASEGSSAFFTTYWYRPGSYRLTVSGTGLARSTASLTIQVVVGPATALDIRAPRTFVAGDAPEAFVRAVDPYRNTASFDDNVTIAGAVGLSQASLQLVAGEATTPLYLTLTRAGDYVITADGGGLHGEAPVTVTAGVANSLVVGASAEIRQGVPMTTILTIEDRYGNPATDFEGNVTVYPLNEYFSEDANPVVFTAADEGNRFYTLSFNQAGYKTITFDGRASIGPLGQVTINVTVLSTVGPRGVAFRKPRDARAIQVNVPYNDGFEVVLRDPEGNPTFAESDIDVTLALDEQVPGPTGLTGTLTRTIIAGRSSVVFADLVFDRDGRFTLLASPIVDLSSATSEPFTVTYRPPEIAIDDITINDGCVDIAYTITQPDGAPVDVLVEYSESESTSIATQAASNTGTQGHYHLASDDGLLKHWRWNASHDLGLANVAVQLTVRARAGSRIIDNPWGRDEGDVTIEIAEGRPCQPEVSALLATPPWPDPTPPTDNDLLYGTDTLAAADMNGDGKLDLLSLAPAGVRISYGRGDGGFELASQVLSPMNPDGATLALATGDFNGDGRTDVALGSGAGGIEVWRQDDVAGNFTFTTSLVAAEGARMTAGDLDGNDSDDLVFIDDEGNITVAYFDEGDFETVAVTPEPLAIDLEVMDADGHAGLDIVYYRFQIVLNDGMFLEHEICVIRTGAFPGGSDRTFSDPDCRFVGEGFDFRVADLTPDPDSLAGGRVFFRSGYPWSQEVRTLTYSDGGFSSPEYVYNACDFATPEGFAIGLFESWDAFRDDPTSDLATSCDYHGASASLDFLVRNFDDNVTDSAYGIDFDSNTTLIAADFTGDGADDVASARGVLATRPRYMFDDYTGVRAPLYENAGSYDEENATVAGDFTNNGIPDFVTAVIEYDGNVTLQLRLDSIYPYHQYNTYTFDVCTAGCPASDSFVVQLARGDLNRDRVDDLIVTTGGDAASGRVYAFTRVGDAWQPFAELPPVLGFVPATLAVGDLLGDGDGRDDIAVAGYDVIGTPTLRVLHWVVDGYQVYREAGPNLLPVVLRESFIGELDPSHVGPELVLVSGAAPYVTSVLATSGCSDLSTACLGATRPQFALVGPLANVAVDGVAMADLEGDGDFELVSQARVTDGPNALHEILATRMLVQGGALFITLALRVFEDLGLCDIGETVACLEPGVGPLVGDLDREGTQDVVVGWNGGRTWEAITAERRYLFGGTVSERASHALLTDIDDNRLLDVLVLEQGEGSDLWMLGQELYPNESPNF